MTLSAQIWSCGAVNDFDFVDADLCLQFVLFYVAEREMHFHLTLLFIFAGCHLVLASNIAAET